MLKKLHLNEEMLRNEVNELKDNPMMAYASATFPTEGNLSPVISMLSAGSSTKVPEGVYDITGFRFMEELPHFKDSSVFNGTASNLSDVLDQCSEFIEDKVNEYVVVLGLDMVDDKPVYEFVVLKYQDSSNKAPVPDAGKEYYCYDDGKVWKSREYKVSIDEVIPFSEMNSHDGLGLLWETNRKQHDHLFDETDFFLKGTSFEADEPEACYFARTKFGTWFGLGKYSFCEDFQEGYINPMWCSGLLDATGEYHKSIEQSK